MALLFHMQSTQAWNCVKGGQPFCQAILRLLFTYALILQIWPLLSILVGQNLENVAITAIYNIADLDF